MNEIKVLNQEGVLLVSSRLVAEDFNKRHSDVLESIKNLVTEKSVTKFFIESEYKNRGKMYPEYLLTRDGFSLLVMGFTGKDALQWKVKYIEAFNKMEQKLKERKQLQSNTPHLASANNTVKILGTLMEKAGIEPDIQLLTAKTVYAQAGIDIPLLIEADQKYYDTAYIAKKVGMSVKKSGKSAVTAVSQLIKSLPLEESETKVFFEGKDNWQGSVTKYSESVIDKVRNWLVENGYPTIIEGESKNYHVVYDTYNVA